MMAQFRILNAQKYEDTGVSIQLTDKYFTVDTAERKTLENWKRKNPHILTYAFMKNEQDDEDFMGFVEILPLTEECGKLFEKGDLLEEDLTADFILPPESMRYAQYLYISGIAVRDVKTHVSRQAAAALVSCGAGMIRHLYGNGYLKKIFANPTTYWGNRIIGRFGLRPSTVYKKLLKAGNDVYEVSVTPEYMAFIGGIERRYQRFIIDYPWPLT